MAAGMDHDIDWQLVRTLVWGNKVKESVFKRWLQPFLFSRQEPTGLLQTAGGPCAVLAPIQAFILKQCLDKKIENLQNINDETVTQLLVKSLCEVLVQARSDGKPLVLARVSKEVAAALQESEDDNNESSSKKMRCEDVDVETFHTCLIVATFATENNLAVYLEEHFQSIFGTKYDVLSFLYSVVLTKGPNLVISERQDMDEPLIDPVHGHGSQSLINLLLTGIATPNVFDGVKDLCGLELEGISSQSTVGFLSLLECLRYLEVGDNLKTPKFPVWVLGSETHLTVLFSHCRDLVKPPSDRESARTKFKLLDKDNSGFISVGQLGQLMTDLQLFDEDEYVNIMKDKLDQDKLGIVLLSHFLEEFFPEDRSRTPDTFTLYHWNGLSRPSAAEPASCCYLKAHAVILEGPAGRAENNPMLQTLQTKWPSVVVDWETREPSLN